MIRKGQFILKIPVCQHDMENVYECQAAHKPYNYDYKITKQVWQFTEEVGCS